MILSKKELYSIYHSKDGTRIGPHGDEALDLFLRMCLFHSKTDILDIGSGGSNHSAILRSHGLTVAEVDMAAKRQPTHLGDYNEIELGKKYDGVWCNHTLEHMPNPNLFLRKIHRDLNEHAIVAITVPPYKPEIVSGHVTWWNMGMLLYHLILAGFDCSQARGLKYEYNISVVFKKKSITNMPNVTMHSGDIERLATYFPFPVEQGFNGDIESVNWNKKF